ncbi:4-diphosphocytidyl-2C-methyl-D-erythritol kinase [Rothia nasimurium]|uniref:GHMP family kinase ATP-binding protein n=1 Tax=Rothia nasimurium TaxID=85336 RepID=UPI003B9FFD6D
MVSVSATAAGKTNLYFAVGPVRPDGYHEVASLYAAVDLEERVTVTAGQQPGISQSLTVVSGSPAASQVEAGAFDPATVPLDSSNLAYRGAEAVLTAQGLEAHQVSLHLHIDKAVPVAGGMGGGSADAAAAMKATNTYLVDLGLAPSELPLARLLELAAPLGADVPFALLGGLAVGTGVGEKLEPLEIPAGVEPLRYGFLASGAGGLSTPAVYGQLDAGRAAGTYPAPDAVLAVPQPLIEALTTPAPLAERLPVITAYLRNDLAAPAITLQPELATSLAAAQAAQDVAAAFVSGSGPTIALIYR